MRFPIQKLILVIFISMFSIIPNSAANSQQTQYSVSELLSIMGGTAGATTAITKLNEMGYWEDMYWILTNDSLGITAPGLVPPYIPPIILVMDLACPGAFILLSTSIGYCTVNGICRFGSSLLNR